MMLEIEERIRNNRLAKLNVDWQDEIIFPYYDGLSIYNVSQTILQIFGLKTENPLDSVVWNDKFDLNNIDRIVLLISDGLGYINFCNLF